MTDASERPVDLPGARGINLREVVDGVVAPAALYLAVYFAALFVGITLGVRLFQWVALAAAALATAGVIWIRHRGDWNVGLATRPLTAVSEAAIGCGIGAAVILCADSLIVATAGLRHVRGHGVPWTETIAVFLPAALHEELVFRGYLFQRLWRWRRAFAIIAVSVVFASLHAWNSGVTWLALANIFLGGVLLSIAYERFERLWLPIGIHFAWNMTSGPILGYQVSGYVPETTLFTTVGHGAEWLTGGVFGIEGSVAMTIVEIVAIAAVLRWRKR